MLVLRLAVLHLLQLHAQLVEDVELVELVLALGVGDAGDGRHDGGCAARADLLEGGQLAELDGPVLHLEAVVARELHEHLVGDRREDGARARGDVRAARADAEEVGDGELLNVLPLLAVEVERGAEALPLRLLQG